jgi:hypothetical protein
MIEMTVDGTVLAEVLTRMGRVGGSAQGPGWWIFDSNGLTVSWRGVSAHLEGETSATGVALVPRQAMEIVTDNAPTTPTIRIRVGVDTLRIGAFIVDCSLRDHVPLKLLPAGARPRDVLRLYVNQSPALIEDAGLSPVVTDVLHRLERCAERAAESLEWLDVTPEMVRNWLLDRERPDGAEGNAKATQLSLFD